MAASPHGNDASAGTAAEASPQGERVEPVDSPTVAIADASEIQVASGQPDDPFTRGDLIGRYVILDKLGQGGMGLVYGAYDPDLNRRVAIKILRDKINADGTQAANMQALLLREAQAMAQLSHPNVLPVYDVGTVRDRVFVATEYIEGQTLTEWTQEHLRSWRELLRVFIAAGNGLAAAHRAGLIHRDFKPDNVMVTADGAIRVMDFGLARLSPDADEPDFEVSLTGSTDDTQSRAVLNEHMTVAGTIKGTPPYMAPEQHDGETVGAAADQYAFCVALWEALYGTRPFAGSNMHKLAQAKRAMQMRPIVRERGVPRWLKRVLLRGLAPEPEARWPSMDPLLHELQQHPIRRTRRIAAVVGVVVVAASSSVVVAYRGDAAPEPCGGARERIQSVWNGQVREHVQAALLSTGRPYAADTVKKLFALVDGYADAWATTRTNTCRATMIHREQSETVMDRKMACLDDSLEQISAYFQALTEAPSDAALDRAAVEFQRMASLELCKDAEALARRDIPVAPTEVQAVDALGAATRRLHALMAATALEPLDAHIESIGKLLLGVSHAPTRAKALWALVAAYDMRGRADERDRSLSQLIDLAAQYDDKTLLSRAWSWRLWIVALEQRRMDVARELIRVAEAAATLARNEPEAAVIEDTVNITIASIEMAAGNLAAAEQRYQEVVARNLDLDPVSTNNNLSIVLVYRGKSAQAREALARAEKLLEGGGELAPPYGDIFMNRGLSYHWEGDLTSAETWYRKAVVLARQSMGDDNAKTWLYRLYLGHLLADVGRWHAADEELEQAATGFAAAYGAKFEFVIHARVQQARVALGLGEITGARTRIDAALSDLAATGTEQITCGYTHPLEVDGMIALAERNWNRAGESFRRAQETYRECYEAGSLRFVTPSIGLAKVDAGMGNLARARATIDEAMVMLREGGSTEHDLRLAEALELRAQLHDGGGSGPSSRDDLRHALRIWETSAPEHPHATALRERLSHNL